jgi:hypothetical protein
VAAPDPARAFLGIGWRFPPTFDGGRIEELRQRGVI